MNRIQPRTGSPILCDSLEKTGRRLTSDPIRTSLGLLPSGPDPVGEWLVHRQSPGPYLGPTRDEGKWGETLLESMGNDRLGGFGQPRGAGRPAERRRVLGWHG